MRITKLNLFCYQPKIYVINSNIVEQRYEESTQSVNVNPNINLESSNIFEFVKSFFELYRKIRNIFRGN